jgi:hypothetical protein
MILKKLKLFDLKIGKRNERRIECARLNREEEKTPEYFKIKNL